MPSRLCRGVETIKPYVDEFIEFAEKHPSKTFLVTEIGCGIAGFTVGEIAPLYKGDNETYIEGPIGNDGIILYNSQMRDRLQTRRTKRNV